jgi:hypothetical protein
MYDPSLIDCFSWNGYKCIELLADAPSECKKCRFKKPERDVTNGVRYTPGQPPERVEEHANA